MATALTAAFKLPSLGGRRNSLLLSPESDVISSPVPKKMRFRRRSSSSGSPQKKGGKKEESSETTPLPSLPMLLPTLKKKKPTSQVLNWVETSCPHDVIPKILAFCGPRTTAKLHQCSRFWHATISSEQTWRVLCEELYKWKEGEPEPESWREFYIQNPCVPVDYPTIPRAIQAVCPSITVLDAADTPPKKDRLTHTIWLRPQEHRVAEPLLLQATEANIVMETMTPTMSITNSSSTNSKRRQLRASILLQTRRRNKPLVHIAAGHVTLKNLRLGHYCGGFNLWCGNACVQVQPITPPETVAPLLPTAVLEACEVISHSGRGIVVNDGGNVDISQSYIHDCAATGIYVGSHSCHLTLNESDLIANGHGNQLAASVRASGVTHGHSGFYLENGNATLTQVNISNNSSCGISVSATESRLNLHQSDVVANGHANQVEVAGVDSLRALGTLNTIARRGLVKVRSQLAWQSCIGGGDKNNNNESRTGNRQRHNSYGSSSNRSLLSEAEAQGTEDDLEHLQDSYVVAEENVRFGELIEI